MVDYKIVREFCIRKLASILYKCVACSDSNREKLDWETAEQFVDASKATVDGIYDCFRDAMGMLPSHEPNFELFDKLCGRAVWDGLYQPLRKYFDLPSRPEPHYTHILFS